MKTYAFIDSQNLNLGIQGLGWKLDFARFRVYLKDKFGVSKAFIFVGYMAENEKLYEFLKKSGYVLIFKPTIVDSEGKAKGNVDAELVLYSAAIEYKNYDQAVIISGDGDFFCLIDFLKKKKKLKRVFVPNKKKFSRLLWEFKDDLEFGNNLKTKLAYRK